MLMQSVLHPRRRCVKAMLVLCFAVVATIAAPTASAAERCYVNPVHSKYHSTSVRKGRVDVRLCLDVQSTRIKARPRVDVIHEDEFGWRTVPLEMRHIEITYRYGSVYGGWVAAWERQCSRYGNFSDGLACTGPWMVRNRGWSYGVAARVCYDVKDDGYGYFCTEYTFPYTFQA